MDKTFGEPKWGLGLPLPAWVLVNEAHIWAEGLPTSMLCLFHPTQQSDPAMVVFDSEVAAQEVAQAFETNGVVYRPLQIASPFTMYGLLRHYFYMGYLYIVSPSFVPSRKSYVTELQPILDRFHQWLQANPKKPKS